MDWKDKKTWIEWFSTPSPVGRRIEEGCALVPPRQFIRTSGGLEKAMLQRYDSGRELMKVGFACDSERHVQKDILLWSWRVLGGPGAV